MTAAVALAQGNPGPVNEGERRVLERLAAGLPSSFELHPNLQVAVNRGDLTECDIIAFGPDCMWVVEVKDLAGEVAVKEHSFVVNGEPRSHPVHSTRLKAQKIKSRLAANPELSGVWIQPLVVLARTPRALRIDPNMQSSVVTADRAVEIIADPTIVGLQRDRLTKRVQSIAKARLALDATVREPRSRFGAYLADELVSAGGGQQWWRAHHEVFDTDVLLQVVPFDALAGPAQAARSKEQVLRAARVGRRLGSHPNLLAPETAFRADDGSYVVVHPISSAPMLAAYDIEQLTDQSKRRVVAGVARLVQHCGGRGVAHRALGPSTIYVTANGHAQVTGFTHARLEQAAGATVAPGDWAALGGDFWAAPEHAGGEVNHPADLFALGRLIEYLWPGGAPEELANAAQQLTVSDPAARAPTAGEVSALAMHPPAPPTAAPAGSTVANRFVLDRQLGRGAHATVWAATDVVTNKRVAVKLYDSTDAGDQIIQEYEALLDVDHPAIVKVRDATKLDDQWALVTELLDGPDLRAVILEHRVPQEEAFSIGLRLLHALQQIHPDMDKINRLVTSGDLGDDDFERLARLRKRGFAHRDVKPENVILTEDRGPVLVDFGLAARLGEGAAAGTPAYRPPDIAPDGVDPDTDLFAVGVILHELLTGEHPYSDRDPLFGQFNPAVVADRPLDAVVARACAPAHADRFGSATEFIEALVALEIEERDLPAPGVDVVKLLRSIEDAISERRWDDALELCPGDWSSVRERIQRRRSLDEGADTDESLLEVDGFSITPVGSRPFTTAKDTAGKDVGPGEVGVYLVRGPAGQTLEILQYRCDDGQVWVEGGDTFQTELPLKRLGQGLRLGTSIDGDQMMIELRIARINDELWSNLYKATHDELDAGAGLNVAEVLKQFGGDHIGTREDVVGDSSKRRTYMCVVGKPGSEHLPVIAHFLTRVLPLGRR